MSKNCPTTPVAVETNGFTNFLFFYIAVYPGLSRFIRYKPCSGCGTAQRLGGKLDWRDSSLQNLLQLSPPHCGGIVGAPRFTRREDCTQTRRCRIFVKKFTTTGNADILSRLGTEPLMRNHVYVPALGAKVSMSLVNSPARRSSMECRRLGIDLRNSPMFNACHTQ